MDAIPLQSLLLKGYCDFKLHPFIGSYSKFEVSTLSVLWNNGLKGRSPLKALVKAQSASLTWLKNILYTCLISRKQKMTMNETQRKWYTLIINCANILTSRSILGVPVWNSVSLWYTTEDTSSYLVCKVSEILVKYLDAFKSMMMIHHSYSRIILIFLDSGLWPVLLCLRMLLSVVNISRMTSP